MGRMEAIKLAAKLGNHLPVYFTSKVIYGYEVLPTADVKVGGRFSKHGVQWIIESVNLQPQVAEITIKALDLA